MSVHFRLAGIYHTGFYQYDSAWGFIRLADAQRLYDEPDLVSVISFKIDDLNRAPADCKADRSKPPAPAFMTTNWMEQNRELFRALKLEQIVTFIVITLIVIVAALNILIALTMMVMEKTRDIAVLMSFGVDPGQVRRIFLLQGLLISVVGTAARPHPRLHRRVGRQPLSHPSLTRRLRHRHASLRATMARWIARLRSLHWNLAACHAVSILHRRPHPSSRGTALRIAAPLLQSPTVTPESVRLRGRSNCYCFSSVAVTSVFSLSK